MGHSILRFDSSHFPVAHKFLDDPEIRAFATEYGHIGVFVLLSLFSEADTHQGTIPNDLETNRDKLAIRFRSNKKRIEKMLRHCLDHNWIESGSNLKLCNYAKYHKMRKKTDGNQAPPPTQPNPNQTDITHRKVPKGTFSKPLAAWPDSGMALGQYLLDKGLPYFEKLYPPEIFRQQIVHATLKDPDWWAHLHAEFNGELTLQFLDTEIHKMYQWMATNPRKKRSKQFRAFMGSWLRKAYGQLQQKRSREEWNSRKRA